MTQTNVPIAVVGVSTLFPGSSDATGFYRDILSGVDRITDVPPSHWLVEDYYDPDPTAPDKTYANRGAFVPAVPFDPMHWGVPPSTVQATDTCQLLALIVAQRVLDDAARGQFKYVDRERISVILGVTSAQELLGQMNSRLQRPVWVKSLREMGLPEDEVQKACDRIASHYPEWQEATFPGVLGNVVAGRIANKLDLGGTNCVTDAACASTFSALSMAVNELRQGGSDVVICGGADTMNDIFMYLCFSKTPALSKSGDCRPFSDQADGTMLGEGFGMVALKRLDEAERDGDRIYAVIRAVGTSSDGRGAAVYAPVSDGQAKAVRRAYATAGYGPDSVRLVEAHGTGTVAGDAAEFEGLRMVFDESGREDRQWCALGSVKSQIGHTKAAAGAAGLVKAVFALQHRVLPPTIKVDRPNPKLDLGASPFHLSTRARPWVRDPGHPRRASVSSFGFGGSNFHVALEEYDGPGTAAYRRRASETELFLVGAASAAELAGAARKMAQECSEEGMFAFLARDTQERYDATQPWRLSIVASDAADLQKKLARGAELADKGEPMVTPDGVALGTGAHDGAIGFVFPGQGSQYVDMGAAWAMAYEAALSAWDEAAALDDAFEEPLADVVFPRPVFTDAERDAQHEKLTATEWAQPAIGVTSLSALRLLDAIGVRAEAVCGHSFGEVSALCAAGVMSSTDAIRVARRRGEAMAEAAKKPGAMVAVAATIEDVRAKIAAWDLDVGVANHNGPMQVVLSGATDRIDEAKRRFEDEGVRAVKLPVSTAFHSPIVADGVAPFGAFLADVELSAPKVPVFANATATAYPADGAGVRALLTEQLTSAVRFVGCIDAMYAAGVRTFVEVGPGSVLSGLVGEILKGRPHHAIAMDRKGQDGLTSLHRALGRLAALGVPMELGALWEAFLPATDPRTVKAPKLVLPISGTNYDKPYPPKEGAAGLPAPNPPRTSQKAPAMSEPTRPTAPRPSNGAGPATPTAAATDPMASRAIPTAAPPAMPTPAMPTPAMPTAQPAMDPTASGAWASAYLEVQSRAIDAHTAYTQAMAQAHAAFLAVQERALATLPTMIGGAPAAYTMQQASLPAPAPVLAAPAATPFTMSAVPAQSAPAPTSSLTSSPVVTAPAPVAPTASAASAPRGTGASSAAALSELMLAVVAEKTGYPREMLELSMDLEADLGVDSIKRVEILAAMRERADALPEVDPAELGKLRTLQEIVDRLGDGAPPVAPSAPRAGIDLTGLMLEVVGQKTGYPIEMLELSMDLEADLGVDSIKRVEILAAVRERAADLPEVDPAELGKLRTLQEIVDRLAVAAPTIPAARPTAPASNVDLVGLMLDVVAQKTGYPVEMLDLGMDLEADLGVDSIKRVEILAAVRERATDLPEVDPAELGKLRTLREIVDRLGANASGPTSVEAPAVRAASAPGVDLVELMLEVVAQKTGYPSDMLDLAMDLEADLGVDSIKRVEILAAVRERATDLPEVDPAELGKLRTLQEIVDRLGGTASSPVVAPSVGADLLRVMLEVVAQKTGYPIEMLELTMDLESDLGVDSIKRVEILAAVRERCPGLPEVDPAELGKLRTLEEIVSRLDGVGAAPSAASASATAASRRAPAATRWALRLEPAPRSGFALRGLLECTRVAVIDGGSGLAAELTRMLAAHGVAAVDATSVDAKTDGLIALTGLREVRTSAEGLAVQREVFALASELANASPDPKVLVTVQDTGGDFGTTGAGVRAWTAGLTGLAKTAAIEWPTAGVRAIDLARGGRDPIELARALADELIRGGAPVGEHVSGGGVEVALGANGERSTLVSFPEAVDEGELRLDERSVVLASGGARGVTAATLIALARRTRSRFVLLGRTPLEPEPASCAAARTDAELKQALLRDAKLHGQKLAPRDLMRMSQSILAGREVRATLDAIASAGGEARYVAASVTDASALSAMLEDVRAEWGEIHAVVHGAGVIADRLIKDKPIEDFDRVLETKAAGLRALLEATEQDPLRVLIAFSSVAGRAGNRGQSDYAMANETLNKVLVAESARRPGLLARSLGWGPWEGGMVTPELKQHFEALGVPLISLTDGAAWLVSELADRGSSVELVLGGEPSSEALLGAADHRAPQIYDVLVSRALFPMIDDHRVKGQPVLPVALVVELFLRAVRATRPDLSPASCEDLRVLRGVALERWGAEGDRLRVRVTPVSNGDGAVFKVELLDAQDRLRYSARATAERMVPRPNGAALARPGGLDGFEGTVYDGVALFHGDAFQVVEGAPMIGDAGVEANLAGGRARGWTPGGWELDPAVLDGALQVALLWTCHQAGGAALPTGIGSLRTFHRGIVDGPVRAVLSGIERGRDKSVSDISLIAADGTHLAELRGVEMHVLPGSRQVATARP